MKNLFRLAFVAALLIAAFGAYFFWGAREKPAAAQQTQAPIGVQTASVHRQAVDISRMGLGTVTAWQTMTITPQVSGRIISIPFREGRGVKENDVLVQIDPRPFQAALDQAKARKAQDEANLANTQKNLQRDQTLLSKGGFATQQTVDNETAQVQMLKAAIEGDQAAIEAAQVNLDFTTLKTPFPGVVSLRQIDLGNLVSPAAIIGTVTQIEPIAVDFTLPQSDLPELRAAARKGPPSVLVYGEADNELLAKGQLEVINNQVDQTTGTIKLKARFENKDHKLWPGAFVQAAVIVRTEPDALTVPSDAIQRGPNGVYVWMVSSDQTAHRHPIGIGEDQHGVTLITNGLKEGDRVVVAGQYNLVEGARITEVNPAQIAQSQG
jgi:multidrug efflux system membrane fusion protein